jgi:hypothetical protein
MTTGLIKYPVWLPEPGVNFFLPNAERPRALEKLAGEMHPEIAQWLRSWKKNPRYQVLIISPMGASEFWGQNSNGDIFEYDQLNPKGTSAYGYKTFERANLCRHHVNKDPHRFYGRIPLSCWNERMKRIEVIAVNDLELFERLGAMPLWNDIDAGRLPPVSMGTRVAFDECSYCGHRSKKLSEYCDHLRFRMGEVLPNGVVIGARNIRPVFFDLSYVHVPAAKESGVLAKVARDLSTAYMLQRPPETYEYLNSSELEEKRASIEKRVTTNIIRKKVVDPIAHHEAPISDQALDGADDVSLRTLLATLGLSGTVLSPREFSYLALSRGGQRAQARALPRDFQLPWCPHHGRMRFATSDFSPGVFRRFRPEIARRSILPRALVIRIRKFSGKEVPRYMQKVANVPDVDVAALAEAYGIYRGGLVDSFISEFSRVQKSFPEVMNSDQSAFSSALLSKHAAAKSNFGVLALLAAPVYFLSAHLQRVKHVEGGQLGKLESFIANNPGFLASAVVNAAKAGVLR